MNSGINNFLDLIGFNRQTVSHRERLITSFGGFCGILGVYFVSSSLLDLQGAAMIVASMGASGRGGGCRGGLGGWASDISNNRCQLCAIYTGYFIGCSPQCWLCHCRNALPEMHSSSRRRYGAKRGNRRPRGSCDGL